MSENVLVALQPGACFHERYRVVRSLKAGGMGAVYEVVDERTDSPRALKIMLPSVLADPDLRARFALEAKVTGNVASDHIVRVSDAGIDAPTGMPFLVMELLRGEELGRMLARRGPLPPGEVVLYLRQAALALDKTHAAGIVHRDLKPENLFVTYRDDGSPCVKILDFGIAKVVAEGTARTTQALGTPVYMAPEQIRGAPSIGPAADLFALGHIAYALLAGEPYWAEDSKSVPTIFPLLMKMVEGMSEGPAARALRRRSVALPPAFDAWMQRAVAPQPHERFDRATALVEALAGALAVPAPVGTAAPMPPASALSSGASVPSSASPSSSGLGSVAQLAMAKGAAPPRSRSVLPAALGAVVLGALAAGALFTMRSRDAGPSSGAKPPAQLRPAAAAGEPSPPASPVPPVASALSSGAVPAPPPPAATATASAKTAPSATSAPRRSAPPKATDPPAPAATRITSPL